MNTKLLRLGRRLPNGARRWTVPGAQGPLTYSPASAVTSKWIIADMLEFPAIVGSAEESRAGLCLARHRKLARQTVRRMIAAGGIVTLNP